MSTRLVDLILTNTPPADILRATAARMRETAGAASLARLLEAALLENLAGHADQGTQGELVQDGIDIARKYMLATGWRPEYEMTGVQR